MIWKVIILILFLFNIALAIFGAYCIFKRRDRHLSYASFGFSVFVFIFSLAQPNLHSITNKKIYNDTESMVEGSSENSLRGIIEIDSEYETEHKTQETIETLITNGNVNEPNLNANMDISKAIIIILDKTLYIYNGKPQNPHIKVQINKADLIENADFVLVYGNNTNVGTATVMIIGIGNYTGKYVLSFKIIPKGSEIKKISAISKGFTVEWRKQSESITGYQIQYSDKKNFNGKKKYKKNVKKKSKTKLSIKKLNSKKKYYVRIRTYKIVDGIYYYSEWSKKKSITTLK